MCPFCEKSSREKTRPTPAQGSIVVSLLSRQGREFACAVCIHRCSQIKLGGPPTRSRPYDDPKANWTSRLATVPALVKAWLLRPPGLRNSARCPKEWHGSSNHSWKASFKVGKLLEASNTDHIQFHIRWRILTDIVELMKTADYNGNITPCVDRNTQRASGDSCSG